MVRTKPALALLAISFVSCYDPAVRDRVVLTVVAPGEVGIEVETNFKQGVELTRQERQEIRETLDRYDLGRDPWLRGFERAGASAIAHSLRGAWRSPESIRREAVLPSAEALVKVMPDAIANIELRTVEDSTDATRRAVTLDFVHIDVPETIRDNRRRLEKEVEAWSESMFGLCSRQCDLYDYLAENADRRRSLLKAMSDPAAILDLLEPREAALLERLGAAMEAAGEMPSRPGGEPPVITNMSFSAFDHDLCVRLPPGAADVTASPGLVSLADEPGTWCFERLTIEELAERVTPVMDPPWSTFEEGLPEDPAVIDAAPFACLRFEEPRDVERIAWERILPAPMYELSWSEAAKPPASQ